ncbi:MAG TPA: alpha/beta hydrolase, partial [Anaerolineae bacterium]
FCAVHYLSAAPEGLAEVLLTGGLPPLNHPPDDVYRATYPRVIEKNRRYYERYPDDAQRAKDVVDYIEAHTVYLPTGDRLSPRRFQQLGMGFGASDGFERAHYLLEEAFVQGAAGPEISHAFLRGFENSLAFDTNPIYACLHEAIYCEGVASHWSAERVRAENPQFDASSDRVCFTGEMIYPWMFDEYQHLRPLKEAAEILAAYDGWPSLYDAAALRANIVPCAAAVYYDDMYVDRLLAEESAQNIRGIKLWITNEYEHNGLRVDGDIILNRLLDMVHGEA